MQFEAETRAVSIGKPCRSLRKRHAAVSGISVPSERNLQIKIKERLLQQKIEMCNQAVELISFDISGMAPGTVSFNKKMQQK